jgi:hypothetical protein
MTAGRADMAGDVLDFARYVLSSRPEGDVVGGLQTKTHLGSPDFDRLLEGFYQSPDLPPPNVFFCGPASLEQVVAKSCHRLGLRMRSEKF